MAELGIGQLPMIMRHYPHMLAEDDAVWSKYLASPISVIHRVWYDVHCGQPMALPEGAGELDRRIAFGVSRKRIDAICSVGGGYWVVEVKPRATMQAVGQVLAYTDLFKTEYSPAGQVWPVVVASSVDEDILPLADSLGVGLVVV